MSDRIIKALGATDEHDALRMVAEASEFMQAVHAVTGRETYTASLETIRANSQLAREILTATDKKEGAEALGSVLAWKASHETLPGVQTRCGELEEEGRKRDVDALIKMGLSPDAPSALNPYAGKLVPATAKLWESEPAAKLKAFLDVAPRVLPSAASPGASNSSSAAASATVVNGRACDAKGRKYEDIPTPERASMKKSDPDLFNALREDWIAAGRPAQSATSASN